ncbi:hypothetical protein [Rhizobium grahamii]|uniref:Uncharacterized protein n=2 Tax=Rhizobium grahamii TaxID=1120045 RepID=S3HD28_9HYPH|nr:hypothetical protein [Rhizobium grahamii]EPE96647.1 hypothetical protein RGCCGE502_18465 [Rhizobium grahamii CCGE 502]RDJ03877.1 hypothetical protein B5K06_28605 [Rhizobium grahamii]
MTVSAIENPALVDDLERQLAHWLAAARTFRDAEEFASSEAWRSVERQIGAPLRQQLNTIVEELISLGEAAGRLIAVSRSDPGQVAKAQSAVQTFRRRYIQVDTTLDYIGDAVNSRTSPLLRIALSNLDRLAVDSMTSVLARAGKPIPRVLVYQDKGTGASILRAGVRLWVPGAVMPVAAIKIVRHNLYRPTSLFHETGHQVAHLTNWVPSVRKCLESALAGDRELQTMWTAWAPEIAADVYAFLHTGYASVAALYDVVGDINTILRWPVGDPHPVGWLRTALGCAFSAFCFGTKGPWVSLMGAMRAHHPLERAEPTLQPLLARSMEAIERIAAACLTAPVPALDGRPMTSVLAPARVSPAALKDLERTAGPALWTSAHWRMTEGIRIVALAGLREAERPATATDWINRARTWLTMEPQHQRTLRELSNA